MFKNRDEERAIERNKVLELGFEMRITLQEDQKEGISQIHKILLKILRRESKAIGGRCCNISDETLSRPEAEERQDQIAKFNSDRVKGFVKTW